MITIIAKMKKNTSVFGLFLLISLQCPTIYAQYDSQTKAQIKKVEKGLRTADNHDVYDSLGEAYLANGDKKLGKKNYLKALKLNPNNENAAKILKTLD